VLANLKDQISQGKIDICVG